MGQKGVAWHIKSAERKKLPTKNSVPGKIIIQNWGKIKNYSDKQKLKKFIPTKLALKKC